MLSPRRGAGAVATQLAADDDAAVREAVASIVTLTDAGRPTALGVALATDCDRTVQLAAIERFERKAETPTPELIALLERVAVAPPQPFACFHCGTANSAERDSCPSCNVVTAKPCDEAQKLLAKLGARASQDGERA